MLDKSPIYCYCLPPDYKYPENHDVHPFLPVLVSNEVFTNNIRGGLGLNFAGFHGLSFDYTKLGYMMPAINFEANQTILGCIEIDGVPISCSTWSTSSPKSAWSSQRN